MRTRVLHQKSLQNIPSRQVLPNMVLNTRELLKVFHTCSRLLSRKCVCSHFSPRQEMRNAYLIQMRRKEEKMMRAREDEVLHARLHKFPETTFVAHMARGIRTCFRFHHVRTCLLKFQDFISVSMAGSCRHHFCR